MLSQLNLRFHKKLIEALKTRAGRENTSVNALAERFIDDGLKTVAPGDGYFQLIADPEATVRQLYRHIILGQTFGTSVLSRDELRFMLVHAREAFLRGHNRLATLPALDTLLDITGDLLAWQVEHDRPVDGHYLKGIFRLA
ncbi:transcriptional repressor PifC, partial [Pseudomonas aeruginosa]|nr:transcriptional repressor PifC [Pseudomonas aeruginosa]